MWNRIGREAGYSSSLSLGCLQQLTHYTTQTQNASYTTRNCPPTEQPFTAPKMRRRREGREIWGFSLLNPNPWGRHHGGAIGSCGSVDNLWSMFGFAVGETDFGCSTLLTVCDLDHEIGLVYGFVLLETALDSPSKIQCGASRPLSKSFLPYYKIMKLLGNTNDGC